MFRRSLVLQLFLLLQVASFSQGTWERVNVPTHQFLKSVCFVDSLYGWAAGDSGTILHTSDAGNTWNLQESHTTNEIVKVFFLDRERGWASSFSYSGNPFGTVILKTINGGADWVAVPYQDSNIFITCILFRDTLNGWMGGKPHALVRTTDGGVTWIQAHIDTAILSFFPVLNIKFYNERYGYACGGMFDIAGVIWRTSDGGDNWYSINPSFAPADEVHELHLFDSLHVMGAGGDPDFGYGVGMIKTWDGGNNWLYQELGVQGNAFDLDFRNDREAWAPLGPQRKFVYSSDTGATWSAIVTPDSSAIYSVTFPDSLHGYAVGQKGVVLKFKPPLIGAIGPVSPEDRDGIILYPNYPNPFSRETVIKWKSAAGSRQSAVGNQLKLKVVNSMGKEIRTLVDTEMKTGEQQVIFNASGLPAGVYFYQLQAGSIVKTGKMILLPE